MTMIADKQFALLVGKAFLHEVQSENRDGAIAFGRAFLLALGKRGPDPEEAGAGLNGRHSTSEMALIEN